VGTDVLVIGGPVGDAFGVRAKNSDQWVFADVRSVEKQACSGKIDRINSICSGAYLLLSDCHKARIFPVGSIDSSGVITHPTSGPKPGNKEATWGGAGAPESERFDTDSELIRYRMALYRIALNPDGEPALYRKASGKSAQELAAGVAGLQIRYGENADADSTGTPDSYVAAEDVADWN